MTYLSYSESVEKPKPNGFRTDLDRRPVEDASIQWPEEESPYRTVARITISA